ncbi:MAG: tRNA (N(6)-L-threonylcarbamoyladenosine(37)-C(2))-methylthiotransferase [Candidatus Lokiarchaeota archaeon]
MDNASFIIINTCTVKQQTENKIKARLKHLSKRFPNKKIIVCGCLPFVSLEYIEIVKNIIPHVAAIINPKNIHLIPQVIEEIKIGKENLIYDEIQEIDKAEILITHKNKKITGIIPISEGCQGSCTYCCVKFARGRLNCYNSNNIVKNIETQLQQGIKQIYLTSQDCSIYNYNNTSLMDLVNSITNLNYNFFMRLGMINPSFLIKDLDQIISILKNKKVYQFLHIPVQSGSDTVLKKMQRPYKISQITDKIEILREKFPNLTISTDIICGFPGETEHQFYRTINLIKWMRPEILNISKFTARPETKAKEMEQVNSKEIKNRSIRLTKIFRMLMNNVNNKWLNWEGQVLILHSTNKENQVFGRNFAYKNIFIDNYLGKIGEFVNVRVIKVDGFNLFANVI